MNGFFNYAGLVESLKIVTELSDGQLEDLKEAVSGNDGYNHSLSRCGALAKRLGGTLDASKVFHLLVSLEFLYDRSREWEDKEGDGTKSLQEFLEITGLIETLGSDRLQIKLLPLIVKNPAIQRRRKLKRLKTGILDTAVGFSSFVDIRPRFADDRSTLEELVPVVIIRVETESEDNNQRSPVFQLNLAGLTKLRAALEDIDKKLDALKKDERLRSRIDLDISDEEASS